jgi:hypothetical protein
VAPPIERSNTLCPIIGSIAAMSAPLDMLPAKSFANRQPQPTSI